MLDGGGGLGRARRTLRVANRGLLDDFWLHGCGLTFAPMLAQRLQEILRRCRVVEI